MDKALVAAEDAYWDASHEGGDAVVTNVREALKAAIAAYEAALWRPVSEAPKDGNAEWLVRSGRYVGICRTPNLRDFGRGAICRPLPDMGGEG